jgi:hypothetical protein
MGVAEKTLYPNVFLGPFLGFRPVEQHIKPTFLFLFSERLDIF